MNGVRKMLSMNEEIIYLKEINDFLIKLCMKSFKENDINKLFEFILKEVVRITKSDGGTIYLLEETNDENRLVIKHTFNNSINFKFFVGHTIVVNKFSIAGYCAFTKNEVIINNINKIPENHQFRQFGFFDKALRYKTFNTIAIPILDSKNEVIGVFQLINKKKISDIKIDLASPESLFEDYSEIDINLVNAVVSIISIVHEKQIAVLKSQENIEKNEKLILSLFESMRFASDKLNQAMLNAQEKLINQTLLFKNNLMTKKHGLEFLIRQMQITKITNSSFTLCYLDFSLSSVDFIGELVGILISMIRQYDVLIKLEENIYILFLYEIDIEKSKKVIERFKERILDNEIYNKNIKYIKYSLRYFDSNSSISDLKKTLLKPEINEDLFGADGGI